MTYMDVGYSHESRKKTAADFIAAPRSAIINGTWDGVREPPILFMENTAMPLTTAIGGTSRSNDR